MHKLAVVPAATWTVFGWPQRTVTLATIAAGSCREWEDTMLRALEGYLTRLQVLHAELERAIEGLAPEALDWSPGPHMNPLCVLVAHASGA
jgi:hypothetical protein